MKTFVINLKKNVERMAAISHQLNEMGVSYERFEAVHGQALTASERRKWTRRFRWWCVSGLRPTDGELGCALSHCRIYERMITENIRLACVLEDDVSIDTEKFKERLAAVESFIDKSRPQVVILRDPVGENVCRHEIIPAKSSQSTECYVLTMPAARVIYHANMPVRSVADSWGRFVKNYGLELYLSHPSILVTGEAEKFVSEVCDHRRRNLNTHCISWKLKRVVGKSVDGILRLIGI